MDDAFSLHEFYLEDLPFPYPNPELWKEFCEAVASAKEVCEE